MFYFKFNINTPWKDKWYSIWAKDFGHLSKNKCFEMQFMKDYYIIGIELDFEHIFKRSDHAGPRIDISLLGYTLSAQIYDRRHWDHDNNCWEVYPERNKKFNVT
jgi:hypothetical protein